MRQHLLLIAAAGLLLAADAAPDDSEKKDRTRLQGYWNVITAEHDGVKTADKITRKLQLIFTDKKMTLNRGDKEMYDATYKLDTAGKRKTIDCKFLMGPNEGKTFKGIYHLNGDRLEICWSEGGQKRPTEMAAGKKSARTLWTLKRGKP